MPAKILDGNALSKQLRAQIATDAAILAAKGTKPGLAVVLVGDHPASQIYVRNKIKACHDANIHSELLHLSSDISQEKLLETINGLNQNP
jgi:methylenetetrahydrofolate dehydrogenase (NADP+)/methenyltetrahydrofolate cyclohydrolase